MRILTSIALRPTGLTEVFDRPVEGPSAPPKVSMFKTTVTAGLLAAAILAAAGSVQCAAAALDVSAPIQDRLGLKTTRLKGAKRAAEIDAFAKVLDPGPLAQLDSDLRTAIAAAAASRAEAERSRALNSADGGVAAKDMETAVAQAKSDALKVSLLRSRLGLEWGPGVALLSDKARVALVAALASGKTALVHVDTANNAGQAGAHQVKVDIGDGSVDGIVIGAARQAEPRLQSSGLMVKVSGPQAILLSIGLTQSAHIAATSSQMGVILPRTAVIRYQGLDWVYLRTSPRVLSVGWCRIPLSKRTVCSSPTAYNLAMRWSPSAPLTSSLTSKAKRRGAISVLTPIIQWSLNRPRLIVFACLWFVALAAFGLRGARLELLPDLAPAQAVIRTSAPGLVAEQVEQLVTRAVEGAVIGAPGVANIQSQSQQGLSVVTVLFTRGAAPEQTRQSIQERVTAASGGLPPGAGTPQIEPMTAGGGDVMTLGFTSDKLDPHGAAGRGAMDRPSANPGGSGRRSGDRLRRAGSANRGAGEARRPLG